MRTIQDLYQLQGLPLNLKISMTKSRIRQWINEYGEDGVYVSFSGGKDSTVLLHLVREEYPNVKAVFVNTGLEYPEIRQFVKTFDNVEWLKPKMNFKQVIQKYGYPFISKEVSEKVYYAQKYLTWYKQKNSVDRPLTACTNYWGVPRKSELRKKELIPDWLINEVFNPDSDAPMKAKALFGTVKHKENGVVTNEMSKMFDFSRYKWMINAPFLVSSK